MKKLFYLLLMLPLAFVASCSDDDDLPQVDLTLTLSGVTQYDDVFYAVKAETPDTETEVATSDTEDGKDDETLPEGVITIDSFTAQSLTNKNAAVANVSFFIDGLFVPPSFDTSYLCAISTANLPVGTHTLSVTANVLQVDKSIANAALNYPLKIVASADDLPTGAPAIGTYSITVKSQLK